MRVLTENNDTFEIDEIPNEIDDIRFCVFDCNNEVIDYYFKPLLFLESFNDIKIQMTIGPYTTAIPLEWSVICGDPTMGELEVIQTKQFNDRGFNAFVFNPITGYLMNFEPLEIINIYSEVKWFFPKLKFGQLVALPLIREANPPCIYVTHQKNNKVPEIIKLSDLF